MTQILGDAVIVQDDDTLSSIGRVASYETRQGANSLAATGKVKIKAHALLAQSNSLAAMGVVRGWTRQDVTRSSWTQINA